MKLYKCVLIGMAIIMFSSCSSVTNSAELTPMPTPDIGIEIQGEKYLEVAAPKAWNTYKINEPISLEIQNISEEKITSGPDFGARIFVQTENGWVEVKNKMIYQDETFTLYPNKNYVPERVAATFVQPDLLDYSVSSRIRIYVVGNLIANGKVTKEVAAYVDLELKP